LRSLASASCYENGQGVPQDYREAAKWYLLAAGKGQAGAQFNLGVAYANGAGVAQDYVKANEWLLSASRDNDNSAKAFKMRDVVATLISEHVAIDPVTPRVPGPSKNLQLYNGPARLPSEVVTIVLANSSLRLGTNVSHAGPFGAAVGQSKILIDGKWVGLHSGSRVLPGRYDGAFFMNSGPKGPLYFPTYRFMNMTDSFTASAGYTVAFKVADQRGIYQTVYDADGNVVWSNIAQDVDIEPAKRKKK
jgi:hypothetical protein